MRQRRIDRLLLRARLARQEGHEDEARIALAEVEELTGEVPETRSLLVEAAQIPQIIDVAVADGDLAIFDSELSVGVLDVEDVEDVEDAEEIDDQHDASVDADLPLYPPYLIASDPPRAPWGPRLAAVLTGSLVLFWFTGPRLPQVPGTAAAEVQSPPAKSATSSQAAVRRFAESVTSAVRESVSTDVAPAGLAATETTGAGVPDGASPGTSPPVSLAGFEVAEPRATSPEPSARADAPPPPITLPLESPPAASVAAAVPISSQPTLDVVTPPAPTPAAPPVEAALPPSAPTPAPAPAPAPTPAPATAPLAEAAAPEVAATAAAAGVRAALMRYESAYSRLDANAASAVWPSLDRKALTRAFEGLASQEVSLGSCEMRIVGDTAVAACAGSATWTPKVGGRSHRESRRWQFRLRNVDAGWQIVGASVR